MGVYEVIKLIINIIILGNGHLSWIKKSIKMQQPTNIQDSIYQLQITDANEDSYHDYTCSGVVV